MTLLDRCTSLHTQILKRNSLRRAHKDAEGLRERASELEELRERVASASARLSVLRAKGVPVVRPPLPIAAMAVLAECQAQFNNNPQEAGRDYGRLKRSIDKLVRDLLSVAEKAIESVRRDMPAVDEAFLRQVDLIPGYQSQVARIRQQREVLLRGGDPGASAKALSEFLDRRDALRLLADELKPDEFPEEVLEFFRAGRHGGAPFAMFTDTVRQWLIDRDLLRNVRVTVVAR